MSTKTTILLSFDDEHWYFDSSDKSKNGNDDAWLEFHYKVNSIEKKRATYNIKLSEVLTEIIGIKELTILSDDVVWWAYNIRDDGFIMQINGDSDFCNFLRTIKQID